MVRYPRKQRWLQKPVWFLLALLVWTAGCISPFGRPPAATEGKRCVVVPMELTGYCNCGICCNWHRTWFGLGEPVISTGPHSGELKKVGYTSSGTKAKHGTVAADTSRFPYGSIVEIPGYGYGMVEDTGGAIKGNHMDLWFPSHEEAMQWGKQRKLVKIWLPY